MNSNTPAPHATPQDDKDDAAWDNLLADPENARAQDELARDAAASARSGALGPAQPMDGSEDPTAKTA